MRPIYAVKDLATQAFGNPFVTKAQGEALRSFMDEVNADPAQSQIAKHPEDYELYKLGDYDDENGQINAIEPQLVSRAKDLITQRSN